MLAEEKSPEVSRDLHKVTQLGSREAGDQTQVFPMQKSPAVPYNLAESSLAEDK